MASGGIMARYRAVYTKADRALHQWDALHSSAVAVATTCINIILRLPALQDAGNYGGCAPLLAAQQELLGKQMASFEAHMARLRELMDRLRGVGSSVDKLAAEGSRLLKEQKVSLTSNVARRQIGAAPSLYDCVEGLQNLRRMLADECRLHAALLAELMPDADAADLPAVQQLLTDQPNLRRSEWRDILLQVSLTGQQD